MKCRASWFSLPNMRACRGVVASNPRGAHRGQPCQARQPCHRLRPSDLRGASQPYEVQPTACIHVTLVLVGLRYVPLYSSGSPTRTGYSLFPRHGSHTILPEKAPGTDVWQASEARLYTFSQETKDKLRRFRLGTSRAKDPQAVICTHSALAAHLVPIPPIVLHERNLVEPSHHARPSPTDTLSSSQTKSTATRSRYHRPTMKSTRTCRRSPTSCRTTRRATSYSATH